MDPGRPNLTSPIRLPLISFPSLFIILVPFLLLVVTFLPMGADGLTYVNTGHQSCTEGEVVTYYVDVTHMDEKYPFGVDVKMVITQDNTYYVAENTRFHLDPTEDDTCIISVYTGDYKGQYIWTNVSFWERGEGDSSYESGGGHNYRTEVEHDDIIVENRYEHEDGPNIFLGILTVSILLIAATFIYQYRYLFAFRGYSLLRKDEVLDNDNRNEIYGLICGDTGGMTASEITRQLGFPHHRLTQYHLRRLHENGYVKMVDKRYYPSGVNAERPFIYQIRGAMLDGAHTPSQIAKKLGTYPNKVKRHMIKNGMWNR